MEFTFVTSNPPLILCVSFSSVNFRKCDCYNYRNKQCRTLVAINVNSERWIKNRPDPSLYEIINLYVAQPYFYDEIARFMCGAKKKCNSENKNLSYFRVVVCYHFFYFFWNIFVDVKVLDCSRLIISDDSHSRIRPSICGPTRVEFLSGKIIWNTKAELRIFHSSPSLIFTATFPFALSFFFFLF